MRSALLLALLAASVHAQPVAPAAPTRGQKVALVAGGVTGGVVLAAAVSPLGEFGMPGVWATAIALPVGTALGVHLAGRLVGVDGAFAPALARATAGALAGFGGAVVGWAVITRVSDAFGVSQTCEIICSDEALAIGVGTVLLVGTPVAFALHDYADVRPVALAGPDGALRSGVALSVRF